MSRRWSLALLLIGLVLLLGAPLLWLQSQPTVTVGDVPAATATQASPAQAPAEVRAAAVEPPEALDELVADDGADQPPDGLVPTRIELPSLDVAADVDPVGLEDDGGMELPEDVARVGWYEPGVRVGEPGTAVLAGHVDSRVQGRGALFDLVRLEPGDLVVVGDGEETSQWRVTGRTRYPKDELPLGEIFRWEGEPALALITCGGDFDAGAGGYRDNVVVYAEPV